MNDEIKFFLDNHNWGGSGLELCLFEFIIDKVKIGSTICELGSGKVSTPAFSKCYKLYSIENDINYVGLYANVNYIHAPIIGGWYDSKIIKDKLPEKLDMVFVDGPLGEGNRNGILNNYDLFKNCPLFIFHDVHRIPEMELAQKFAHDFNKKITLYDTSSLLGNRADFWATVE